MPDLGRLERKDKQLSDPPESQHHTSSLHADALFSDPNANIIVYLPSEPILNST